MQASTIHIGELTKEERIALTDLTFKTIPPQAFLRLNIERRESAEEATRRNDSEQRSTMNTHRAIRPLPHDSEAKRKEAEQALKWVQAEAEIAMKEKLGEEEIRLKPTTEQAASIYLDADPGATHGALNLATDVPLFYHLARIV